MSRHRNYAVSPEPLVFSLHVGLGARAWFYCRPSTLTAGVLSGRRDRRYSRPIVLVLTCRSRSAPSINAPSVRSVTCHLASLRMWHPRPRGGGGGLPVVAALLYSRFGGCMCFQLQTKERRCWTACGSI